MELYCKELFVHMLHGGNRTICRTRNDGKALRCCGNIIGVAHPAHRLRLHIFQQQVILLKGHLCFPILANRALRNGSAQRISHQLCAVANSKYRNPEGKNFRVADRRALFIYGIWSP